MLLAISTQKILITLQQPRFIFFVVILPAKSMNHRMKYVISFVSIYLSILFSFTVHGFRYLSIYGPPNRLTTDDVECLVVHSETTLKGHFITSNPIINQIQHNIQWGQLSNLMSVPTDWYVRFIYFFREAKCSFLFYFKVPNVTNVEDGWVMQQYQSMKPYTYFIYS